MKNPLFYLLGLVTLVVSMPGALFASSDSLIISEIMYNPPEGGTDSLEFIEIYNSSDTPADASGFIIAVSAISDTIPAGTTIPARGFYVTAVNARAFRTIYGVAPSSEWPNGGLSNGGNRTITITSPTGTIVNEVTYLNSAPWPTGAAGTGASAELCGANLDNTNGANWGASTTSTGQTINGSVVFASPFALPACTVTPPSGNSYPRRSIGEMISVDANGQLDSINVTAEITGIVTTQDFNGGAGIEFYMQDITAGIRVLAGSSAYTVAAGDELVVRGRLEQRNGSAQFTPDSIGVVSIGQTVTPRIVSSINESNQGLLVRLQNYSIVDSSAWLLSGSFNVFATNGTDTIDLRILSASDVVGMEYPTGTFDVTGISNQFDSSTPFDEGYQLIPRSVSDFTPYIPGSGFVYPLVDISSINQENPTTGIGTALTQRVAIEGIAVGFNLNDAGLLFTVVDAGNNGLAVYSQTDDFGYTVIEGDLLRIEGTVDQFRGLIQLEVDDLRVISSGNQLPTPMRVTSLGQNTESKLITLQGVKIAEASAWRGDGSAFNTEYVSPNLDTFAVRIDDNSPLSTMMVPDANQRYDITGIGSQFDSSTPALGGYQLFPRTIADFNIVSGTRQVEASELFTVLAKADGLHLESKLRLQYVAVYDSAGRLLAALQNVQPGLTIIENSSSNGQILIISAVSTDGRAASSKVSR